MKKVGSNGVVTVKVSGDLALRKLAHAIYKDIFHKQKLKISSQKFYCFYLFGSKHTLWVHTVLRSTHNVWDKKEEK